MLTITNLFFFANCYNWTFDATLSLTASQVNPDDVLKLENQRAESVLDDSGDVSEDEEYEDDEQAELTETDNEQENVDSVGVEEEENDTDIKTKESDENSTPTGNKKAKVTQKPKGTEYKLIR